MRPFIAVVLCCATWFAALSWISARRSGGGAARSVLLNKAKTQTQTQIPKQQLGLFNKDKGLCDGKRPGAMQSPIAITEGPGGNVLDEALPNVGWVGLKQGGLFRMKTPGTDEQTGEPGQTLFVKGNVFDLREVGAQIKYEGAYYTLEHFELKTPSEHTINGRRYIMEQQFFHKRVKPVADTNSSAANASSTIGQNTEDEAPDTLVMSALFDTNPLETVTYVERLYNGLNCLREGTECHQAFSFADMARTILFQTRESSQAHKGTYSYNSMDACMAPPCAYGGQYGDHMTPLYVKPNRRANMNNYFLYMGSLTQPPCTERVAWLVLKNPLPIAEDHAAEFRRTMGEMARPLQPSNGRTVLQTFPGIIQ